MSDQMKQRGRQKREVEPDTITDRAEKEKQILGWVPITELGKKVKNGELLSMEELFEKNFVIMEPEIVDILIPDLLEKLVAFKKTSKVRRAGRMFGFRASVLVGDGNQFIGLGTASDKERWPAIRKAAKKAKLSLVKVRKGCGSWQCTCGTGHSVPFKTEGKSSSIRIELLPAPKGTGLVVGDHIKDVLRYVGIQDVWSKSRGSTSTTLDFVSATVDALSNTVKMRISEDIKKKAVK
ncbi:MAG: 30S ribosomal protein S5 [Candidatus Diapherotrites archaeon]